MSEFVYIVYFEWDTQQRGVGLGEDWAIDRRGTFSSEEKAKEFIKKEKKERKYKNDGSWKYHIQKEKLL